MKNLLEELGFEYDEHEFKQLIGVLAGAQRHRLEAGRSTEKSVTRSTALVALASLDPRIETALVATGLDWKAFCDELGLAEGFEPADVDDVDLHADFHEALAEFRDEYTLLTRLTPGNIVLAIVTSVVRNPKQGLLGTRLASLNVDFNALHDSIYKALVTSETEAPDSRTEPQPQSEQLDSGPDSDTDAESAADRVSTTEANTQFIPDDAEVDRDDLGRGVLAIALGRRLHRIWCRLNNAMPTGPASPPRSLSAAAVTTEIDSAKWTGLDDDAESCFFDRSRDNTRAAFVMHLDAPWGGGKTTFANFLARVLNPLGYEHTPTSFLRQRYGDADLSSIFLTDPEDEGSRKWREDGRRPWIIVSYNAWQSEHVSPPWWAFYQAIRKRCFASVVCEGLEPVDPTTSRSSAKPGPLERLRIWLTLWFYEVLWRVTNPKILLLGLTAVISFLVFMLLYGLKAFGITGGPGKETLGFDLASAVGLTFSGLTLSGSLIWGFGAVFADALVPGSDTLAERLSLGQGDPFERFRKHFFRTIERLKRPVLVVVDDIDRCQPEFIVELVRGMQTILRSPRIVFLLIGDRDWIERAFESHHKAMSEVSVGPEQTFGARFVEKAIQMSFILPGIDKERQADYVEGLLLGRRDDTARAAAARIDPESARQLRKVLQDTADTRGDTALQSRQLRQQAQQRLKSVYEDLGTEFVRLADPEVYDQWLDQELSILAAADEEVEQEVSHRLLPLSHYLPANPRQVKRIVNAVTMYQAVAIQQMGLTSDDERWFQLAVWIVVMTEWPRTWRLLAGYPAVADLVSSSDPGQVIGSIPESELPGSVAATLKAVEAIRADQNLVALISGSGDTERPALDGAAIRHLRHLTPLDRDRTPLAEVDEDSKETAIADQNAT